MTVDEARALLRSNHRGILITRRRDGRPQGSPVAVTVDDEGFAVISTRATAVKAKNAARDPQVSVVVVSDEWYGPWAQIDGTAEVVHLPEAMEGLVDYYRRISGEHPDWDDYRRAMRDDRRVLLRIAIEAAGPNRAG